MCGVNAVYDKLLKAGNDGMSGGLIPDSELKRFRRFLPLSRFKSLDILRGKRASQTKHAPFIVGQFTSKRNHPTKGDMGYFTRRGPIGGDPIKSLWVYQGFSAMCALPAAGWASESLMQGEH